MVSGLDNSEALALCVFFRSPPPSSSAAVPFWWPCSAVRRFGPRLWGLLLLIPRSKLSRVSRGTPKFQASTSAPLDLEALATVIHMSEECSNNEYTLEQFESGDIQLPSEDQDGFIDLVDERRFEVTTKLELGTLRRVYLERRHMAASMNSRRPLTGEETSNEPIHPY